MFSSGGPSVRFGTGVAIIVSETKIKLGGWHTVTLYRDGLNGLLQLNNGTPVTGQSQVSARLIRTLPPSTLGGSRCRELADGLFCMVYSGNPALPAFPLKVGFQGSCPSHTY